VAAGGPVCRQLARDPPAACLRDSALGGLVPVEVHCNTVTVPGMSHSAGLAACSGCQRAAGTRIKLTGRTVDESQCRRSARQSDSELEPELRAAPPPKGPVLLGGTQNLNSGQRPRPRPWSDRLRPVAGPGSARAAPGSCKRRYRQAASKTVGYARRLYKSLTPISRTTEHTAHQPPAAPDRARARKPRLPARRPAAAGPAPRRTVKRDLSPAAKLSLELQGSNLNSCNLPS